MHFSFRMGITDLIRLTHTVTVASIIMLPSAHQQKLSGLKYQLLQQFEHPIVDVQTFLMQYIYSKYEALL